MKTLDHLKREEDGLMHSLQMMRALTHTTQTKLETREGSGQRAAIAGMAESRDGRSFMSGRRRTPARKFLIASRSNSRR